MANLIVPSEIQGQSVYGVRQMQYAVDGASGQDFASALTVASFRQSTAIENAATSCMEVVRQRQRKVDDLGVALALLAKAVATLSTDNDQSPDDKSAGDDELKAAAAKIKSAYGVTIKLTDGNKVTRGDALKAQSELRYALDVEDNNLQQDSISLQGLITKRDNAFSSAAKIVRKALNASGATIHNIE